MAKLGFSRLLLLTVLCALSVQLSLSACPRGWIQAGTGRVVGCYKLFSTQRKNFAAAERYCEQQGGYLARDLSGQIHNKIKGYIRNARNSASHPSSFWIGLTDNNKNGGPWLWIKGPNLGSFKYFVSTPRNTPNKQDCAYVVPAEPAVKWHITNNCNQNKAVICQRNINTTPVRTTPRPPRVNCPRGWQASQSQKTCVRLYTQPKAWLDARAFCQQQGGDLVKIPNGGMNGFVNGLISHQKGTYWIGLHDRHKENMFEWLDEDTQTTFKYWGRGEPNNAGGNENCVMVIGTRDNKWNDAPCQNKLRFVCQHVPTGTHLPRTTPTTPASRNCGAGWEDDPNTDSCYQINSELLSWLDAQAACKSEGGNLATISTVQEQFYLSARTLSFDGSFFWIGANDRATETGWKWSDNAPFAFLNWDVRQPNNQHNSDCVAMIKKSGRWDDLPCASRYGYICEKKGRVTSPTPRPTTSPAHLPNTQQWGCQRGWRGYRGSCYQMLRSPGGIDWNTASSVCSSKLASLVAITDAQENKFIYSMVPRNFTGYIWLGLNDVARENSFTWSDNTPITYTNWSPHEPNNINEEDCVVMYGRSGKWNDAKCSTKVHLLICKQPKSAQPKGGRPEEQGCPTHAIGYNAQCYSFIYQPAKSFTQAQAYCKSKGGNLATVDNRHVQAFIGAEMYHLPGAAYWIGLSSTPKTNNAYAWNSGFPVDFTSWDKTHTGLEQNTCVAMQTARPAGLWVNNPCTKSMPYICETPRRGFTTPVPTTTTTSRLPCPPGWFGWSNMCYKGFVMDQNSTLSWGDAKSYCSNLAVFGTLATIRNHVFEAWMKNKVLQGASGAFWIGLNDRDSEGGYVWTDNGPLTYTNWGPNEPNDYQNREDCTQWILPQNYWNDNYCYITGNFICQIPRGVQVTTPKPTPTMGMMTAQCGNTSWTLFNNNCYFVSPTDGDTALESWFEAHLTCLDMGADLASVLSDDENGYLTTIVSRHPVTSFWIGLNDLDQDIYKWSDQNPLSYVSWNKNEPNDALGGERCVEFTSTGMWNDLHCQDQRGYVCKKRPGNFQPIMTTPASTAGGCPRGFHSLPTLSMCYYVGGTTNTTKKNYDDAMKACDEMVHKSKLASIHSSLEEKYITTLLADLKWPAWIGFNDRRRRNQFEWIDNLNVEYTFWGWHQPDENLNDDSVDARRDCVDMEIGPNPNAPGKWNDKKCSNKYAYVCESKKGDTLPTEAPNTVGCSSGYERFRSSCYKYYADSYTWSQAEGYCSAEGGHLVSINDRMEQAYVELLTQRLDSLQMWVGLSYQVVSQSYTWSDNWPVMFTNWGHGEPDRSDGEGCVSHTIDGKWQDVPCKMQLTFVCEIHLGTPPVPTPPIIGACPDNTWLKNGDYCYKLETKTPRTWAGANFACSILGAQLASIHTDPESHFLTNQLLTAGVDAWIGLNKGQQFGYGWSDKTPVSYLYWGQGEPSDADSYMHQDCVKASSADGTWDDTDCGDNNAYICKRLQRTATQFPPSIPAGIVVTYPPQPVYTNYGPVTPYNPFGPNPPNGQNTPYNPNGQNTPYNPNGQNTPYNPSGQNTPYNPNGQNTPYNPGGFNRPSARPQTGKNVGDSGSDSSSGLSGGAVAGVVLGTIAIIAVGATVSFLGRRYLLTRTPGPMATSSPGFDNATYSSRQGDKVALAASSDA